MTSRINPKCCLSGLFVLVATRYTFLFGWKRGEHPHAHLPTHAHTREEKEIGGLGVGDWGGRHRYQISYKFISTGSRFHGILSASLFYVRFLTCEWQTFSLLSVRLCSLFPYHSLRRPFIWSCLCISFIACCWISSPSHTSLFQPNIHRLYCQFCP